jgi:serine protease Do
MTNLSTQQLAGEVEALVNLVRPSVVGVGGRHGFGAGVVWQTGLIATNDHVAETDRPTISLTDDTEFQGRVVARDSENDIALIRIDSDLAPAKIRSSDDLRVGELAIALGHPLGMREIPTFGMISGIGDSSWMGQMRRDLIQVDVSLAPGNSGGPILDASARVFGIACMIASPGMALVIPSRVVQRVVDELNRRTRTAA